VPWIKQAKDQYSKTVGFFNTAMYMWFRKFKFKPVNYLNLSLIYFLQKNELGTTSVLTERRNKYVRLSWILNPQLHLSSHEFRYILTAGVYF